jgi:tetratricopeptide (TPR) repeat protein
MTSLRAFTSLLVIAAFAVFAPSHVAAKGPGDRATGFYLQGNAAYEQGDFAGAAALYRKALDEGAVNDRLYYNYANSLFRQQQLGMAILYYEKARKLAPDDEDIAFNLRFASAQTVDKNPVPEPDVLTKALWIFHSAYSINEGMWVSLGLFSACFLLALLAIYAGKALRGALVFGIVVAGLGLLVLIPSLVYKIRAQETVRYAIVLTPVLEMYSGPGDNYQVLTKVHEGTKFEIVEVRGDWASVKLLNGKGGFVRYADLGKV